MNESNIKADIIRESIDSLQDEGLRFSIDTLAKRLKISKKTVYKYFSTKEELAVAVYEAFYNKCILEVENFERNGSDNIKEQLLNIYYRSNCLVCEDIFNKFSLNEKLRKSAKIKHGELWKKIAAVLKISDVTVWKIIVDGAFDELRKTDGHVETIIDKIEEILC